MKGGRDSPSSTSLHNVLLYHQQVCMSIRKFIIHLYKCTYSPAPPFREPSSSPPTPTPKLQTLLQLRLMNTSGIILPVLNMPLLSHMELCIDHNIAWSLKFRRRRRINTYILHLDVLENLFLALSD